MKQLIISEFFLIRTLCFDVMANYDKYYNKIKKSELIRGNMLMIATIIYRIVQNFYKANIPAIANNQKHLSEKDKIKPLNSLTLGFYIKF